MKSPKTLKFYVICCFTNGEFFAQNGKKHKLRLVKSVPFLTWPIFRLFVNPHNYSIANCGRLSQLYDTSARLSLQHVVRVRLRQLSLVVHVN